MELRNGYKLTEVGVIPSDWEVKELGEIGNFKNGINKSNEDFGFGFPFANLMDVFGKSSIQSNKEFGLINSNEAERKLYNLTEGDVLFIRSSVKPSGVGLTCVIEHDLPNTVFSGFIIRFRDKGILVKHYKRHCFYDSNFRNSIIGSSTVSANTNINQEALKKLRLIIPTKSEQTAIATALSDADALINSLEKLIAKKRNIKQGAMQELLKPKKGWVERKLTDVVDYIHGKAHERDVVEDGEFIIVNSKFISTEGRVVKYSNANHCPTKTGDILTVLSDLPNGKALAKCFYVDTNGKYAVNQRICIWRAKEANPRFLFYLLNRHRYFLNLDDGVTQTHILNKHIEACRISLPIDVATQTEIGQRLFDIDVELRALESKFKKCRSIKQGMMQELLTGKIRLI